MQNTYRLMALYDRWSYSHWADLQDHDASLHPADHGPDLADFRLLGEFPTFPTCDEVDTALAATDALLSRTDGCHQRRAHVVLDDDGWTQLIGQHGEFFMELAFYRNGSPSPIVEQCHDGARGRSHDLPLRPPPGKPTAKAEADVRFAA